MTKPNTSNSPVLKGFDDWIEIFRAGKQIASDGSTREWTHDDLDEIVENHSADDPSPIVIGHPKKTDKSYGWADKLKRAGDSLYAKFADVNEAFAQAVEAREYRKRSISVGKTDKGWTLIHTGFFGAKPVAVAGMKDMKYSYNVADYTEVFEFEQSLHTASLAGLVKNLMRRMRDWVNSENDLDMADKVLPQYLIDEADFIEGQAREDRSSAESGHLYSHPLIQSINPTPNEGNTMTKEATFSQADIDAAVDAAREKAKADFKAKDKTTELQTQLDKERHTNRVAKYQAQIDGLIGEGRMTPGMATGLSEFMAVLPAATDQEFTFSVGEGDKAEEKKSTAAQFFEKFLGNIPPAFAHLFKEEAGKGSDSGSGIDIDDAAAIAGKAAEFKASEEKAGRTITITQAVSQVTKQSGASA